MEFNIVSYLRYKNIEPIVTAKSESDEWLINKDYAIAYDKNLSYRFNTLNESDQWWQIDFTKRFHINSYKLIAGNYCNFVTEWKLDMALELDDSSWFEVHSHESGWSDNQTIELNQY